MAKLRSLVMVPVAVSGVLGLVSGSVLAASDIKRKADSKQKIATLSVDELPSLYTTPEPQVKYVEPESGHVEQGVAFLRKWAEPHTTQGQQMGRSVLEKAQEAYKTVEPTVKSSKQIVQGSYELLRNPPPDLYPSIGVMTFSGILGLYLAKGSKVKRVLIPTALITLTASLFYPQHAAAAAKASRDFLHIWGSQGRVAMETLWQGKPSVGESQKKP